MKNKKFGHMLERFVNTHIVTIVPSPGGGWLIDTENCG